MNNEPSPSLDYSRFLYEDVKEWYKNADMKAQILLTLMGAFVTFLTSSIFVKADDLAAITKCITPLIWGILAAMLVTITLSHIAFNIPFVYIIVRARLADFDRTLEEAAQDLGADEWRTFITAFDDEARWKRHVANIRRFGPVKLAGGSDEPRRFGAGRKPDSEATAEYLARLRTFPPIFTALLYTGARLNDVISLTWDQIDFDRGTVTIVQDKRNNKRVTVPMAAPLRRQLEQLQRGMPHSSVFRRPDGQSFSDREVQRAFAVARKIAGLRAELTPHSLRHTFASWLVMHGTPLRTVQELLGHADIRMTIRYAHLSPSHLAEAVNAIEAIGSQTGTPIRVRKER